MHSVDGRGSTAAALTVCFGMVPFLFRYCLYCCTRNICGDAVDPSETANHFTLGRSVALEVMIPTLKSSSDTRRGSCRREGCGRVLVATYAADMPLQVEWKQGAGRRIDNACRLIHVAFVQIMI